MLAVALRRHPVLDADAAAEEVVVVAPDEVPLGRLLGTEISVVIRGLHKEKGVRLDDGDEIAADLVVVGTGPPR
ncbi:hypothetical protein [Sphingomonas sp.]|uniref:hypothetical protein n=1 Tax=Sphingomonas sp. TaxID=28214 RepID=UPI003B00A3FB